MKKIHFMFTAVIAAVFASCDEHMDFPDTAMKIGDIVCTDGAIVRYEDVDSLKKHLLPLSSTSTTTRMWKEMAMRYILTTLPP